eukprot:2225996-Prymnesium_polylepis.1
MEERPLSPSLRMETEEAESRPVSRPFFDEKQLAQGWRELKVWTKEGGMEPTATTSEAKEVKFYVEDVGVLGKPCTAVYGMYLRGKPAGFRFEY